MEIINENSIFQLVEKEIEPKNPFARAYIKMGRMVGGIDSLPNKRHLVQACPGDHGLIHLTPVGERSPIYMIEADKFANGEDDVVLLTPVEDSLQDQSTK